MMVVDLTLGFLGKTIPQLNVLAAGLSLKAMVGIGVLALGMAMYTTTGRDARGVGRVGQHGPADVGRPGDDGLGA